MFKRIFRWLRRRLGLQGIAEQYEEIGQAAVQALANAMNEPVDGKTLEEALVNWYVGTSPEFWETLERSARATGFYEDEEE